MGISGCESLQRKFTRKSKKPLARPAPVVNFQAYAMTPLERYKKHYLLFQYWNDELLQGLQAQTPNAKRSTRASAEALSELRTLQGLLHDDLAGRLSPLIEERARIDRQLRQGASVGAAQLGIAVRTLEHQTRELHRDFFWRDLQDRLKEGGAAAQGAEMPATAAP
jgi:hypothetical protein